VVYEDLNGNGRQDTGEPGIGGVTVNRSGGAGTATSLDGSYRFSNVSVGSYTLAIAVPAGYVAVGRTSRTVSVASGGAAQANFSVQAQGVIQGLVFDDRNGNGVQDSGETGINGAAITRGGWAIYGHQHGRHLPLHRRRSRHLYTCDYRA
jgi:hypothetical protein